MRGNTAVGILQQIIDLITSKNTSNDVAGTKTKTIIRL